MDSTQKKGRLQNQAKIKKQNKKKNIKSNITRNKSKIVKVNNYVSNKAKIGKNVKIWHFAWLCRR